LAGGRAQSFFRTPILNRLPHFQQPELFRFVVENEMVPIGFCPIGSPRRPDRDRTPEDTVDTEEDMEAIEGIDKNCRLIKGQVFLWKEEQSWEDLWDLNGEITPP